MELQVIVFSSCYIYWLREGTIKLEICFRKIFTKLTGLAVRIYSKKPKGKNTMKEKKNGGSHAGISTCTPTASSEKSAASDHSAM